MTINMFQSMAKPVQFKPNPTIQQSKTSSNSNEFTKVSNNEKFGKVFQQITKANDSVSNKQVSNSEKDMLEVIQAKDVKELLELLGAEVDDSQLFVQLNGETLTMDSLLSIENITELLAIDTEDLSQLLSQFGMEDADLTDTWSIIEQGPALLDQLKQLVESGEVSNEDALMLLQLFKVTEQLGAHTDTAFSQQTLLSELQSALNQVIPTVLPTVTQSQQANTNKSFTTMIQSIQTVQVEQKVETVQSNASNTQNESMFSHQQANQANRTVSVTLPTNPASQSEALAKEIANLVNRSQLTNSQGTIKLMLKLFPENLGQIRIEIMQQNGVMSARILASTAAGKELLDSSLNQLKTAFVAQNIQMDRIDVTQALQETDKNFRDQSLFGNFFKQKQEEEDNTEEQEEEESISFSDLLIEEVQG